MTAQTPPMPPAANDFRLDAAPLLASTASSFSFSGSCSFCPSSTVFALSSAASCCALSLRSTAELCALALSSAAVCWARSVAELSEGIVAARGSALYRGKGGLRYGLEHERKESV